MKVKPGENRALIFTTFVKILIMMKHLTFIAVLLSIFHLHSQISSPSIGETNLAAWFALGIRQDLDTIDKKESMTYVGFGRSSQPDNYRILQRPTVFVVNQEYYQKFGKSWQYSVALSYYRDKQYKKEFPFQLSSPSVQQEIRAYGRIGYFLNFSVFKLTLSFREEFRNFFNQKFGAMNKNLELRSRLRLQLRYKIDPKKIHQIELGLEALGRTQHYLSTNKWKPFEYSETDLYLYYSYSPTKIPFTFDFGYMNYISPKFRSTQYFGFDIVWNNPFGEPHRKNIRPTEFED